MKMLSCTLDGCGGHDMGRELLRRLYFEETVQPLPPVLYTQTGYPYLKDSPYYFSISHTDRHVFCVLSRRRIGIDAEELSRVVRPSVACRVLSPSEKAQYDAAEDKNTALLTFWVLKEAAAKCSGLGLQGFPNRTVFSLEDPRVFLQDGCVIAIIEE